MKGILGTVLTLLGIGITGAWAGHSLPAVSIVSLTATSPRCGAATDITVTATVSSTFDMNESSSTTDIYSCNQGNNYCGTSNSAIRGEQTVTTRSTAVSNTNVTVFADDGSSTVLLTGSGTYSGTLYTAADASKITITVTANLTEDVTTVLSAIHTYYDKDGIAVGQPEVSDGIPNTVTNTAVAVQRVRVRCQG